MTASANLDLEAGSGDRVEKKMELMQQQIVLGRTSGTSRCVDSAIVDGTRYIVHSSGQTVYIHSTGFSLVQSIPVSTTDAFWISAVAIDRSNGLIAVATGNNVVLYKPRGFRNEAGHIQWNSDTTLELDYPVKCLAFNCRGSLVAAGSFITLWEKPRHQKAQQSPQRKPTSGEEAEKAEDELVDSKAHDTSEIEETPWRQLYRVRCANEISEADFSPDGLFLATRGHVGIEDPYDRLVKVWYMRPGLTVYGDAEVWDFLYLTHPRSICSFEWRRPRKDRGAVIEASNFPMSDEVFAYGASPSTTALPPSDPSAAAADVPAFPAIHWLQGEEVLQAIDVRDEEEAQFLRKKQRKSYGAVHRKNKRLKDAVKDYPDMLFQVQHDGGLVIWGVQGKVVVYHNARAVKRSSIYFPAELHILAQNQDGVLNCYALDLDDFFTTTFWTNGYLRLRRSWGGHRSGGTAPAPTVQISQENSEQMGVLTERGEAAKAGEGRKGARISGVKRHPNTEIPLMASVHDEGEVLVYRVCVPQYNSVHRLLKVSFSYERHLAATKDVYGSDVVGILESYDASWPLDFLHAYPDKVELKDIDRAQEQRSVAEHNDWDRRAFVVGISRRDHMVFTWEVLFKGALYKSNRLVSRCPLPIAEGLSTLHVVATDDLCSIHCPVSSPHLSLSYASATGAASIADSSISSQSLELTPSATSVAPGEAEEKATSSAKLEDVGGAHMFLTLADDGMIRLWQCKGGTLSALVDDDGKQGVVGLNKTWRKVAEFSLDEAKEKTETEGGEANVDGGRGMVTIVETHSFGKMAIVTRHGSNMYKLSIWSNEAMSGLEMVREWVTIYDDPVVSVDWHLSSDGQHLLAVALGGGRGIGSDAGKVHVYCQQRQASVLEPTTWKAIGHIALPWTDEPLIVSWLHNGSILVATDRCMMRVYDKWMGLQQESGSVRDSTTSNISLVGSTTPPNNIFYLAYKANGRLPDHHPQLLTQYLLWGKYDLVQYLLSTLYTFVRLMTDARRKVTDTPVPLWKILANEEVTKTLGSTSDKQYDSLFVSVDEEFEVRKESEITGDFHQEQASFLSEQLTKISLPNITHLDQMNLLAVIDTVVQVDKNKRSLDENGVRYLLFMKLYQFALKTFPPHLRTSLGLSSRDIAWGYYSESQDILLEMCTQAVGDKLQWKDAKGLGMGFWIKNLDTLKRQVEAMARNQYMAKEDRDPIDCSLLYMALRKRNVLLGLWKLANAHPEQSVMVRFLANDFSQDKWQKAAVKNAFVLLGKQRYEYAVAFFLLGERLKDATSVCLKQLNDPQLAIVICRLFEGDNGPVLQDILQNSIIPTAIENGDRFLVSMCYSILKDRAKALSATLAPLETLVPPSESPTPISIPETTLPDPALLILYQHLRKYYKTMRWEQPKVSANVELKFIYQSACAYERMGCPALALNIICNSQTTESSEVISAAAARGRLLMSEDNSRASGIFDPMSPLIADTFGIGNGTQGFGAAKSDDDGAGAFHRSQPLSSVKAEDKSSAFDWSEPVSTVAKAQDNAAAFDWSEPVSTASKPSENISAFDQSESVLTAAKPQDSASAFDWSEPVSKPKDTASAFDWSEPVSKPQETASAFDWSEPVSKPTETASAFDWSEPVSTATKAQDSSLGFDWSEPVSSTTGGVGGLDWGESVSKSTFHNDDYEAFRSSFLKSTATAANELELEFGGGGQDAEGLGGGGDKLDAIDFGEGGGEKAGNVDVKVNVPSEAGGLFEPYRMTKEEIFRYDLGKRNMRLYKWQLAMRIVQAVYHSATIVSKNYDVLSLNPTFRDYFEHVREGIKLFTRCKEMDAVVGYTELIPLRGLLPDYSVIVSTFMVEVSNTLARLALTDEVDADEGKNTAFLNGLSRRLLWALVRWQERVPASKEAPSTSTTSSSTTSMTTTIAIQTAATAFLALTVCSLRQKKYGSLWWLVGLCDRFFEMLLENAKPVDFHPVIREILQEKNVAPPPMKPKNGPTSADSDGASELLEDDYLVDDDDPSNSHRRKTPHSFGFWNPASVVAESLLRTVSLMHVALGFEAYLSALRETGSTDESFGIRVTDRDVCQPANGESGSPYPL
ncbi:regulator of (H+)-ATPase in vacuolar membrane [Quaeritorhiza haematococci]|nr:regulator of (H+)-ATPase in vacuolar membrane [Quaeritorhiza haematococci]